MVSLDLLRTSLVTLSKVPFNLLLTLVGVTRSANRANPRSETSDTRHSVILVLAWSDETNWDQKLQKESRARKKDCWLLMRSCGNFVVIWFHCNFHEFLDGKFSRGHVLNWQSFQFCMSKHPSFCLVTKLASKRKRKKEKIITTSTLGKF